MWELIEYWPSLQCEKYALAGSLGGRKILKNYPPKIEAGGCSDWKLWSCKCCADHLYCNYRFNTGKWQFMLGGYSHPIHSLYQPLIYWCSVLLTGLELDRPASWAEQIYNTDHNSRTLLCGSVTSSCVGFMASSHITVWKSSYNHHVLVHFK